MNRFLTILRSYLGILLGVVITAIGLGWFLIPNRIAAGGVSGLATVTYHLFEFPVGITMLALNIPLLIAGIKGLGASYGIKTVFGAVSLSILVEVVGGFPVSVTTDALLSAIYGGVISGIGLGIAFRFGGSTGGTDMAAQLIAKYFPISVGQALLVVDGIVIILAGVFFGAELALYALLTVYISTKTIDLVQEGQSYAKAAFIISQDPEGIGKAILAELERGVTALAGTGVFTGTQREVLFVIVSRNEITRLKMIVNNYDEQAFVVIADVYEVLGEGFKKL